MDEEFLRDRAVQCRSLAENADQFIKPRLVALAARYEQMLEELSQARRAKPFSAVRDKQPALQKR